MPRKPFENVVDVKVKLPADVWAWILEEARHKTSCGGQVIRETMIAAKAKAGK